MKENKVYIGIDPDVDKSGVAYYDSKTKFLQMTNQSFFNLNLSFIINILVRF